MVQASTMTHKEILEKAIQKAIDGEWKGTPYMMLGGDWMGDPPKWKIVQPFQHPTIVYTTGGVNNTDIHINTEHVIFNHDFAKSFFGAKEVCFNCGLEGRHDPYCAEQTAYDEAWKYHLREMVVYENPIGYLGENL